MKNYFLTLFCALMSLSCLAFKTSNDMQFSYIAMLPSSMNYQVNLESDRTWDDDILLIPGLEYKFKWSKHNDQEDRYIIQYTYVEVNPNLASQLEQIQEDDAIWFDLTNPIVNPNGDGTQNAAPRDVTFTMPCDLSVIEGIENVDGVTIELYLRLVRFDKTDPNDCCQFPKASHPVKVNYGGKPTPYEPYTFMSCSQSGNFVHVLPGEVTFAKINDDNSILRIPEYREILWFTDVNDANLYLQNGDDSRKSGSGRSYVPFGEHRDKIFHFAIFVDPCNELQDINPPFVAVYIKLPNVNIQTANELEYYLVDDRGFDDNIRCSLPLTNYFPLINPTQAVDVVLTDLGVELGEELRVDFPDLEDGTETYITVRFDLETDWFVRKPHTNDYIKAKGTQHLSANDEPLLNDFEGLGLSDMKVCVDDLLFGIDPSSGVKSKDYSIQSNLKVNVTATTKYIDNNGDNKTINGPGGTTGCPVAGYPVTLTLLDLNTPAPCEEKMAFGDFLLNPNDVPLNDPTGLVIAEYLWTPDVGLSDPTSLNPYVSFNDIISNGQNPIVYTLEKKTISNPGTALEQVLTTYKCVEVEYTSLASGDNNPVLVGVGTPGGGGTIGTDQLDESNFTVVVFPNPTDALAEQATILINDLDGNIDENSRIIYRLFSDQGGVDLEGIYHRHIVNVMDLAGIDPGFKFLHVLVDDRLVATKIVEVK